MMLSLSEGVDVHILRPPISDKPGRADVPYPRARHERSARPCRNRRGGLPSAARVAPARHRERVGSS